MGAVGICCGTVAEIWVALRSRIQSAVSQPMRGTFPLLESWAEDWDEAWNAVGRESSDLDLVAMLSVGEKAVRVCLLGALLFELLSANGTRDSVSYLTNQEAVRRRFGGGTGTV